MTVGVMKTNDIVLLFKGVSFRTDDIRQYIISLLQKFEVALLWDSDNLLIPSLLPTELDLIKNPALMRQILVCRCLYLQQTVALSLCCNLSLSIHSGFSF